MSLTFSGIEHCMKDLFIENITLIDYNRRQTINKCFVENIIHVIYLLFKRFIELSNTTNRRVRSINILDNHSVF